MADVFISYAHEDQAFVRRMVPALEAEGFSVWWDHTIPPGQSWDSFIARGIKEAKAAIVVWSATSVASEWVKEEASLARGSGKYLPVQIDSADPPIGFTRIQAAQLLGWDGDANDPQWQMLVGEVRRVMAEGGHAAPEPRRRARHTPSTDAPARIGPSISAIVLGLALVAGAAGGGWYAWRQGWFGAAEPAEIETAETPNSESPELAELRRQMAETQAALEQERRLREDAQQTAERQRQVAQPAVQRPPTEESPEPAAAQQPQTNYATAEQLRPLLRTWGSTGAASFFSQVDRRHPCGLIGWSSYQRLTAMRFSMDGPLLMWETFHATYSSSSDSITSFSGWQPQASARAIVDENGQVAISGHGRYRFRVLEDGRLRFYLDGLPQCEF